LSGKLVEVAKEQHKPNRKDLYKLLEKQDLERGSKPLVVGEVKPLSAET